MTKPRYTLSKRLSLAIILMAVPVFILSLSIFFVYSRNLLHQRISEHTNSILNTTTQHIINYMGAVKNTATSNEWLLEEFFTPDSLQAISQRMVKVNRSIISCSVGTEPDFFPQNGRYFSVYTVKDGDTIYSVREDDYEYFDKMWYKTARSADKPCWINPFSDYAEASLDHNDAVASYAVPLHTSDGRIAGVVATDFSFTRLARIIKDMKPPYPSAYYVLLGGDGRYLVHPDDNVLFKKTIFSDNDANDNANLVALGHEMVAGKSGTMHVTIGGQHRHVCYRAMPGTNWSLALVIRSDELLGPYHYLLYVVVGLIFAGLVGILILSYRVVRKTTAPVYQLIEMTDKIGDGQYDNGVIPLSDRRDAVAQLQNSFAAMQKSINTQMGNIERTAQEIGKYNVQEDEKVEEAEESIRRKNEFIANVMDQIRRPLDVIRTSVAELRSNEAMPHKELADIANRLNYNTNDLSRMLHMLYDSSEPVAADTSLYNRDNEVMCNQLARECINYIEAHFLDEKISFETELPDNFHVQTNYLYLMRSIREVLYNAAKYSDGQHILLRVTQTADMVRFTIQDVGPGLPENAEEMIFKPFMKLDNLSEGFGLGLPLCMRHIVGIGGNLIYDASYKEGCRFFMEVPKD